MQVRCGDLEVAVHEWGSGPPLVLLHGLGDDHRAWRKLVPGLALRHRVIAPDLRGHAGTTLGQADGTLGQLTGDVAALLDALGLDRVDLAGFSMGGTIALRVAIDRPARIGRLLPIATSSRVGRTAVAWYRERAGLAEAGDRARLQAALAEDTPGQFAHASPEVAEHLRLKEEAIADPRGFANGCRAMAALGEAPLDPDLPGIALPVLVVSAELDPLCPPRAGESIAAAIPGARFELIADSGHEVAIERPDALLQAMLPFLDAA